MESSLRNYRRRSGYEPSDTETDWPESPKHDNRQFDNPGFDHGRSKSPSISGLSQRRHSKSPYKARKENGNAPDFLTNLSPLPSRTYSERMTNPDNINETGGNNENVNPFSMSERRKYISPLKTSVEVHNLSYRQVSERSNYSRRAASAPRARLRERGHKKLDNTQDLREISHKHGPSMGEINEMVANAKISRGFNKFDTIDSISPEGIFFSREYPGSQKVVFPNKSKLLPKPPGFVDRIPSSRYTTRPILQRTVNSSSAVSRQSSNASGRTSASTRKFVANVRKSQTDAWFSCIKKGSSCKSSNKSPEKERPFDEASFIGKAIVVESLRPFWAEKYQPASLMGYTCHRQEAMLLKQLATSDIFPHILLKGPPGSGKKSLTMSLLREIYGDPVWNISHDLRYFHILESRPIQVVIPVSSSPHHVELNVYLETNAAYALTALVKEISSELAVIPEISTVDVKKNYKVLVLYDVDKAAENIQHLIKWIIDCYSDSCKLILCCEDDIDILESVKSRCKIVKVEAPVTHEIMEVLIQIANKEGFELSMNFAAKIATKSKQNLRRAIMALEACKAHNYPFAEDQPIPLGWEESLVELAAEILADPLTKRLFIIRGKIQKLLADFVHPKLILLKLVEQFLQGVEASMKRELYYWYAYYDKRLPMGTSALLKLEEFVAKFMSIYRKSSSNRQL